MAATFNDQIGRVLGGRYRLLALIGTGASAQVFLADDTTLRRRVAVKILHPAHAADETFLRRFRAEAQAAAAMNHPHILAVYDWGQEHVPYLVCEYLGGGSLRDILDAGHRLTPSQTLLVGLEAARGLEYAHRRGFVHRDIKPANLLFDEDARLRIADFGIARALAEAGLTEPHGAVIGTVRYASPEQAKGEPLTGKSDVYALALAMNEMVTGTVPFATDTVLGTLMARIDQEVPVGPELGPLQRILERAGRPDPADRPDAGDFIIGLMATAEELDRPAPLPLAGPPVTVATKAAQPDRTVHASAPGALSVFAADDDGDTDQLAAADPPPPADATTVMATPGRAPVPPPPPPSRVVERQERTPAEREPPPGIFVFDEDDDRGRRRWPWVLLGVLIVLGAVGGGVGAYLANRTVSHAVPDLTNATVQDVQALATKNKWVLPAQADQDRSDTVTKGNVIRTDPPARAKLAEGQTLHYTVSIGNKLVTIPPLAGLTVDDATAALTKVGLVLAQPPKTDFDEQVPAGKIIRVDILATELPKGDPVPVVVSQGPKPRTVPTGLEGQPLAVAQSQFQQLQLALVEADEYSDTVAQGSIIRIPAAGTQVPPGTQVQVVVSQGRAPRAVPNVAGKFLQQAIDLLTGQGFVVNGFVGDASKPVIATDPPANSVQPYGTKVRIITSGF